MDTLLNRSFNRDFSQHLYNAYMAIAFLGLITVTLGFEI